MNYHEKEAVERVKRAGVKAPESAILAWVRCAGPKVILAGSLAEIRRVASAF